MGSPAAETGVTPTGSWLFWLPEDAEVLQKDSLAADEAVAAVIQTLDAAPDWFWAGTKG